MAQHGFEPFAVELYRRQLSGETIDDLVAETGIRRDRIEARIRGASLYLSRWGREQNCTAEIAPPNVNPPS